MSTRYYGCISVRETDYARPEVRALFDEKFANQYVKPKIEDGVVTFVNRRAYYGRFPELEDALKALGVAFDRKSAAYNRFPEMLVQYRTGDGWVLYPMIEGEYVLPASYVQAMKDRMTAEEFLAWAGSLSEPSPLQRD